MNSPQVQSAEPCTSISLMDLVRALLYRIIVTCGKLMQ